MGYNFSIEDIKKNLSGTDTWKIVFSNKNNVTLICDDAVFILNCNNVFIIPADSIYKILGDEDSYSVFEFSLDTDYPFSFSAKGIPLSDNDILLYEKLLEYDLSVDLQNICVQKTLELLFLNITMSDERILPIENDSTALFKEAVTILKKNIHTSISVDALAKNLGISLSNIKRLFAKYSQFGVHDYFNLLKINNAKSLLRDGHSVTETAALTGFANQAYFSAAFKRITGVSAKEFLSVRTRTVTTKQEENRRDLPSYLL